MLLEIVPQRVIEEGKKLGSFRNISFWRLACVNDVRNIDLSKKASCVAFFFFRFYLNFVRVFTYSLTEKSDIRVFTCSLTEKSGKSVQAIGN